MEKKRKFEINDRVSWACKPYGYVGDPFFAYGYVKKFLPSGVQVLIDTVDSKEYTHWFKNRRTTTVSEHNLSYDE